MQINCLIFFQSQPSSPDNPFEKSTIDFDFIDVDESLEPELGRPMHSKKKDVLEEGNLEVHLNLKRRNALLLNCTIGWNL